MVLFDPVAGDVQRKPHEFELRLAPGHPSVVEEDDRACAEHPGVDETVLRIEVHEYDAALHVVPVEVAEFPLAAVDDRTGKSFAGRGGRAHVIGPEGVQRDLFARFQHREFRSLVDGYRHGKGLGADVLQADLLELIPDVRVGRIGAVVAHDPGGIGGEGPHRLRDRLRADRFQGLLEVAVMAQERLNFLRFRQGDQLHQDIFGNILGMEDGDRGQHQHRDGDSDPRFYLRPHVRLTPL